MSQHNLELTTEEFHALLKTKDYSQRQQLLRDLFFYNYKHAVDLVLSALGLMNGNENIGWEVANWLGKSRNMEAVEPLLKLLSEKDTLLKVNTIYALGFLGDKRAVEPLIESLNDTVEVSDACIEALRSLDDKRAVEPLINLFLARYINDCSPIIMALGELGDARALEPLLKRLDISDDDTYFLIIEVSGKLHNEQAFPLLLKWLTDQNANTRISAAYGLGHYGDKKALPALEHARDFDKGKGIERATVADAAKAAIDDILEGNSNQKLIFSGWKEQH